MDAGLQDLVDDARDAFIVVREDRIEHATSAAARHLGYDRRDDLLGKPALSLFAPEEQAEAATRLGAAKLAAEVRGQPARLLCKDGRVVTCDTSFQVFAYGGVPAVLLLLGGASELRHARATLRLLETALQHQRDAVIITEAERVSPVGRRILFVNEAFTRLTGFRPEEVLGRTPDVTVGERTDPQAIRRLQAAVQAKVPIREEILKYRKDGSTLWVELDLAPVFDDSGECTHFVGVMRDVTERREMQARLLQSDRMASIGTLAAGVAHEINNPLTYVIGNLEFISEQLEHLGVEDGLDPVSLSRAWLKELAASAAEALHGADRVRRVVRDLLTFARAEDAERGSVDVQRVVETAIGMVRNEIRYRARLVKEFEEVPPAQGSEARLGHVFLNLLLNAVEAIPEGNSEGNEIRVRIHHAGGVVHVDVRDTGLGIPPDVLPRVFDPFFTTKPPGVSTGLGLSICHGIITSLGGRITVDSEPGRSTTFRVSIPAAPPAENQGAASFEAALPSPRARVLLVDDEPGLIGMLQRRLRRRHDVKTALTGREAVALLERDREFDVILCDVMMPDLSGVDLYRTVAQRWPGLEERIVFMSGGAFTPSVVVFLEGIRNPCLEKPLDATTLEAILLERAGRARR